MTDYTLLKIVAALTALSILVTAHALYKQHQENKRLWQAIEELKK